MNLLTIRKILKECYTSEKGNMRRSLKDNHDLLDYFALHFSEYTLREIFYILVLDLDIPKCRYCDNNSRFIIADKKFSKTCGDSKCRNLWNSDRQKGIRQSVELIESRIKPLRGRTRPGFAKTIRKKYIDDPSFKEKISAKSKEFWSISENRERQSNIMKEKILNGSFTPAVTNSWANSRIRLTIKDCEYKFRSSWEAMYWLLNTHMLYEKIRIPYMGSDNKKHIYMVDFVDFNSRKLIEIKPEVNRKSTKNRLKELAAENWCTQNNYNYEVISEDYFQSKLSTLRPILEQLANEKLLRGLKSIEKL